MRLSVDPQSPDTIEISQEVPTIENTNAIKAGTPVT